MTASGFHVVTGAFGYSGKYIARRLLAEGREVRTLTDSTSRSNPFGTEIRAHPFCFHDPARLTAFLRGARVLYNTYWVRFNHTDFAHALAVENTKILFAAAREAGVERIVHVSITNPSLDSKLEYFAGKAELEDVLMASGLSYAILRPTVLFGREDILINNIAWLLRRFPVFGVFGDGEYRLQPIYVDDLAGLAVDQGLRTENRVIEAIGPETFTYQSLVQTIGRLIGRERPVLHLPPSLGWLVGWCLGKLLRDVVITREEIAGFMQDLLHVEAPPAGKTRLTDWIRAHADTLGARYASELSRRRDRAAAYGDVEIGKKATAQAYLRHRSPSA
jgi:NADH dehydrogenase